MFDVPPPENDDEAIKIGNNIRQWIKQGRPTTRDNLRNTDDDYYEEYNPDEKEKPKKKKGILGFLKK